MLLVVKNFKFYKLLQNCYFSNEHIFIREKIKLLINQEQDEYVLGLLKLKGLYNGVKE